MKSDSRGRSDAGNEGARVSGEYDSRITAYFGDAVLRAGFMPVPHLFMRHYRALGLNTPQAMFVLQVMESAWDLAEAPRTVGDLARRMDVDKRTIRKYSEEVEALGLITLYDQFDANGAQVENGYDLSPLFQRLARLAPEPSANHGFRRRQMRREAMVVFQESLAPAPMIRPTPGPDDPPSGNGRSATMDQAIPAGTDQTIMPPRNDRSALKRNARIPKNQNPCMMHDVQYNHQLIETPQPVAGMSLRWQQSLSSADVQTSAALLQRMGVDNPVRDWIAQSLAPAEVWALRVYGMTKGWRTGLIVSQVYDKHTKKAQPAAVLTAQLDAVGRLLAALEPSLAEQLLVATIKHCPHTPDALEAELSLAEQVPEIRAAVDALWHIIAELRGMPAQPLDRCSTASVAATVDASPARMQDHVWATALDTLEQQLPAFEFETWIKPTSLVLLEGTSAIVGVPNVFAREQLQRCYVESIGNALQSVIGCQVQVQFVIGM